MFGCCVLIRMLMLLIRIVLDYETSDSKQNTATTMIMIQFSFLIHKIVNIKMIKIVIIMPVLSPEG